MRGQISITYDPPSVVSLRSIGQADLEALRIWKNRNRHCFFFQEIISPEQQEAWFRGFQEREDDFMFVVLHEGDKAGCLGFRMIRQQADVYNVILGQEDLAGSGVMGSGLRLMCSYILSRFTDQIGARVLKNNPALGWYKKNGFEVRTSAETHFDLRLAKERFQAAAFREVSS